MKNFGVALGLATLFAVGAANAAPINAIYDTISGGETPTDAGSSTLTTVTNGDPLADSFNTTGPTQLHSVTARLYDATPSDGGSVLVYLVPTDPARNTPWTNGTTTSNTLTGKIYVGTILDSSLPTSLTGACALVTSCDSTVYTSAFVPSAGEYWISLVDSSMTNNGGDGTTSNALWEYDANGSGLGTTNEFRDHANATGGLAGGMILATNGAYEMTVTTPEPASLAILGAGLIGLGFKRRRRAKKGAE